VVRFGGKTYVCILGHTSTSNFYTDLTANWNLASDGQVWLGTWAGTTTYKIGDTVKYGGLVYICNLGHTSQATLEADSAKWDTFASAFDWKDSWAITTVYKIGDIVKYGATIYRCKLGHTSAGTLASGLELDQSKWDVLNQSFDYKGTFATTTRYKNNDVGFAQHTILLHQRLTTPNGVSLLKVWNLRTHGVLELHIKQAILLHTVATHTRRYQIIQTKRHQLQLHIGLCSAQDFYSAETGLHQQHIKLVM
jgi:hypothetical protein